MHTYKFTNWCCCFAGTKYYLLPCRAHVHVTAVTLESWLQLMYSTQHCIILQAGSQFGITIATDVFHSALYNSSSWKPVWWPGQGQCIYWLHINYEVSIDQGLCGMSGSPGLRLLSTQKSQRTARHTQHQTISFSGVGEGSIFFQGEELCRIWGDSCVILFQVGSVFSPTGLQGSRMLWQEVRFY